MGSLVDATRHTKQTSCLRRMWAVEVCWSAFGTPFFAWSWDAGSGCLEFVTSCRQLPLGSNMFQQLKENDLADRKRFLSLQSWCRRQKFLPELSPQSVANSITYMRWYEIMSFFSHLQPQAELGHWSHQIQQVPCWLENRKAVHFLKKAAFACICMHLHVHATGGGRDKLKVDYCCNGSMVTRTRTSSLDVARMDNPSLLRFLVRNPSKGKIGRVSWLSL